MSIISKINSTKNLNDINVHELYVLGYFFLLLISLNLFEFKNVFKLPETSLYGDKIYIVEDGIAKKKKINLIYKGPGYILVTGNLTNKDLIVSTKMPEIFNNKKVIILTN